MGPIVPCRTRRPKEERLDVTETGSDRSPSRAKKAEADGTRSLNSLMTERLRTDILAGRFAPGERLLLSKLQSLYDAGAAPVREALARLAVRGLVDFEDQRGFRAKTFDLTELDDLVRTRQDIESLLVRDAIAHGDVAWSGDLAGAFAVLKRTPMYGADRRAIRPEWEAAHRIFHHVLVSGARSVLLKDYHAVLWDQAARYRGLVASKAFRVELILDDHRTLMEAMLARDTELAAALSRGHIRRAGTVVIDALDRQR